MNATMITAEQFQAILDKQIATLATKGRKQIEAEAKELKERIAFQRGSRTNYEGGGTVASLEGQLERLRKAWKLAR